MDTLRESNEDDFEFVFQLNKANMQKYVQMLRGWDDEAEREDMRRHFRSGTDQIIIVDECKIRSEIRGGCLHSKNAFKQLTNQSSEEVVHLAMSDARRS